MSDSIVSLERLFLALADKTRLRLLGLMAHGEVSVGYLAGEIGESQPKVSRHLAYLRNAGIVSTRRDGKWIFYCIVPPPNLAAANVLTALIENLGAGSNERGVFHRPEIAVNGERTVRVLADETWPEGEGIGNQAEEREELDVFLL